MLTWQGLTLMMVAAVAFVSQQPPLESMPIYATAYSWDLGGTNCNNNCGDVATGLATGDHLLGRSAGCIRDWAKINITRAIQLPDGSEWFCIDTFGREIDQHPRIIKHPAYGWTWVIRVDFAVKDPQSFVHNQELIYGWQIEWRPVSELFNE